MGEMPEDGGYRENDGELLRKYVKLGSHSAFGALVDKHLTFVHSVCMRSLGDRQLAEDATQVVFMVLARKASTLSSRVFLPAWLFQTARLTSKDLRRRELRRARYEEQAVRETIHSMRDRPAVWLDIEPVIDDLMARLKPEDRDALLLRFYEERDFADIARNLGVTEDAARRRTSRALSKLRHWLANEGIGVTTASLLALIIAEGAHYPLSVPDLASQVLGGATSAQAAVVSKGVLKSMWLLKLKLAATVAIGTAATVATVVVLTHGGFGLPMTHRSKTVAYEGQVVDDLGQPIPGATVSILQYEKPAANQPRMADNNGQQSATYNPKLDVTQSDSRGRFVLNAVPANLKVGRKDPIWNCTVMVDAGNQVGFATLKPHTMTRVKLLPAATAHFHIVDRAGKPVSGVPVIPRSITINSHEYFFGTYNQAPERWLVRSDSRGDLEWNGLPTACSMDAIVASRYYAVYKVAVRIPPNSPQTGSPPLVDRTVVVTRSSQVFGRILRGRTSGRIANVFVRMSSLSPNADNFYDATTDARGRFHLQWVRAGRYLVQAVSSMDGPHPPQIPSTVVDVPIGGDCTVPDMAYVPDSELNVRVTAKDTGLPVTDGAVDIVSGGAHFRGSYIINPDSTIHAIVPSGYRYSISVEGAKPDIKPVAVDASPNKTAEVKLVVAHSPKPMPRRDEVVRLQ